MHDRREVVREDAGKRRHVPDIAVHRPRKVADRLRTLREAVKVAQAAEYAAIGLRGNGLHGRIGPGVSGRLLRAVRNAFSVQDRATTRLATRGTPFVSTPGPRESLQGCQSRGGKLSPLLLQPDSRLGSGPTIESIVLRRPTSPSGG
jgi:hypothetical protein